MTPIQRKIAELMELSSFNSFDGEAVVVALEEHDDLWLYFYMTQYSTGGEALILRDLAIDDPFLHMSTLFILCESLDKAEKLIAIIAVNPDYDRPPSAWNASTAEIITRESDEKLNWWTVIYRDSERCIVKVWWD